MSQVTIKQIARQSGVSAMTASRILSGKANAHAPDTRARVMSAAQALGYRANTSARAMRQGRFNTIALLQSQTDGIRSLLPPALLDGVHDALAEQGHRLLITRLPDEALTDAYFMPGILSEAFADGLLINYNALIPERLIELLELNRIPAIWVNSKHVADCIYPDDFRAGYNAVRVLNQLGHTRIAYVDLYRAKHYSAEDRLNGYRQAMCDLNLTPILALSDQPMTQSERLNATEHWLSEARKTSRPTAAILYSNHMAMLLLMAVQRLQIAVPKELSLIVVNDRVPDELGPCVGAMIIPQYEMGRQAVEVLSEKIKNPTEPLPPRPVPPVFVAGDTCLSLTESAGQ